MRDLFKRLLCWVNCPGCGSSNVTGGGDGPYLCGACGSMWQ